MGQRRQLLSIGFLCLAALVPPGILAQPSAPPATGSATQEFVETDLGPVEGKPLSEEQDHPERQRWDQRDEPRLRQHASALHEIGLVEVDARAVAIDE